MKKIPMMFFGVTLMTAQLCFGEVWEGGAKTVEVVRFMRTGVYVGFNPPLENCNGGNQARAHVLLKKTHENYNALVSVLLTLKTTQTPIRYVWVSNEGIVCGPAGILTLEKIEY